MVNDGCRLRGWSAVAAGVSARGQNPLSAAPGSSMDRRVSIHKSLPIRGLRVLGVLHAPGMWFAQVAYRGALWV